MYLLIICSQSIRQLKRIDLNDFKGGVFFFLRSCKYYKSNLFLFFSKTFLAQFSRHERIFTGSSLGNPHPGPG